VSTPAHALAALAAPDQTRQGRAHTPETGEITAERLADVEAHAVTVRAWNPDLLPGLLQTTRYAAAAVVTTAPAIPSEEVQRRAHHRAARVDRFLQRWQDPARTAVFIVGEAAIRRPLTHRQAHRAQVRHVLNLTDLPNVDTRVMPTGTASPGRAGQCSLYGLEQGARLGYTETPLGGWYTRRAPDVALLLSAFDDMLKAALSADDSRSLLMEELTA
jgi:hypothetical protein